MLYTKIDLYSFYLNDNKMALGRRKHVNPLDLPHQSVPIIRDMLKQFVFAVSRKFLIPEEELNMMEPDNVGSTDSDGNPKVLTCLYYMASKKKCCNNQAMSNGYCTAHQTYANLIETQIPTSASGRIITKKTPKLKPITKTEAALLESMNNAVPQMVTPLKRGSKGLFDPVTEIMFDEQYMVIGVRNKDKISKLSYHEVEICEQKGWKYLDDCVYNSEDEDSKDEDID